MIMLNSVLAEGVIPADGTSLKDGFCPAGPGVINIEINGVSAYNFTRFNVGPGQTVRFSLTGDEDIHVTINPDTPVSELKGKIAIQGINDFKVEPEFHIQHVSGFSLIGSQEGESKFSSNIGGLTLRMTTDDNSGIQLDRASISNINKVKITTGTLSMINQSIIAPRESVDSTIEIVAKTGIQLVNSEISNSTTAGTNNAVTMLETPSLSIDQNSRIHTRTGGENQAGDIFLSVNHLELRNDSSISVSSLVQNNDGSVSFKPAGGNITIKGYQQERSKSVLLDDSSKIFARSVQGTGGNISIKTEQFFGLRSNIDASSERGSDGIVNLSVLETDAVPSTQVLTTEFKNDLGLNDRPCQQHVNKSASQFFVKGRAGLAPSPDGLLMAKNSGIRIKAGEFVRVTQVTDSMVDNADGKKDVLFDCGKS